MGRTVLAIDIQDTYLAGVLMGRGVTGFRLSGAAVYTVPDGQSMDLAPGLTQILSQLGNRFDRCVVSLSADRFFFRTLGLPFDSKKKITQILDLELETYLPLHAGEFESDFCLLDRDAGGPMPAGNRMVSVTAIQKTALADVLTELDACGLSPDGITVGTGYSEALAFAGSAKFSPVAVFVYVQTLWVAVYMIRSGRIAFCRCAAMDPEDPVNGAVRQLSHTLLAFRDRFGSREPVPVAGISGSAPFTGQVADLLKAGVIPEVVMYDAAAAEKVDRETGPDTDDTGPKIGNALAMAANEIKGRTGFDFNRRMSPVTRLYRENRAGVWVAAVLTVLVLLAGSSRPFLEMSRVQARVQAMDQHISGVFYRVFPHTTPMVDPVRQMQMRVTELKEKHAGEFMDGHPLNIDVLHAVSTRLPPDLDIVLARFVRMENSLTVAGSADLFNTVDKMKTFLETTPGFRAVEINSAALDKTDNRVRFSLRILLGQADNE
jgi:general secretion pathway protein L